MNYRRYDKELLVNLLTYSENAFLEMIKLAEDAKEKAENLRYLPDTLLQAHPALPAAHRGARGIYRQPS